MKSRPYGTLRVAPQRLLGLILSAVVLVAMPSAAADDWRQLPDELLSGPAEGEPLDIAREFIEQHVEELGLLPGDIADAVVSASHRSDFSRLTHIYMRQRHAGLEVFDGDLQIHIKDDGSVFRVGTSYVADLATAVSELKVTTTQEEAVRAAAALLDLTAPKHLTVESVEGGPAQKIEFAGKGLSHDPIKVRLVYQRDEEGVVRLAWDLAIDTLIDEHYWNLRVDAATLKLVDLHDYTAYDSYRVYQLPAESPNHVSPPPPLNGSTIAVNPADPIASPSGWTTTNFTVGNNVDSYEDTNDSNGPTGGNAARANGPGQIFDYTWNWGLDPRSAPNQDAAITNLFYMNNMLHDILFHNGFDEASGNFQETNFSGAPGGGDSVNAEAQDGGGLNNANFATGPDGNNPRMQMYLWDPPPEKMLTITAPAAIAGTYLAIEAGYTPPPQPVPGPPGISAGLVLVDDGSGAPSEGCNPIVNGAAVNGQIALVDRGSCSFTLKAANAENAGAIAIVVTNNVVGAAAQVMGGNTNTSTIPSVMIGYDDGALIKTALQSGPVSGKLENPTGILPQLDGDLDNGIIAHEYGHGVSNRLVGGRTNTNCLGGQEQAGEGWSDLLALFLTMEPGDQGTDVRGIGTFAIGQSPTGGGIRPWPYSTDQVISQYVYSGTQTAVAPHGVGAHWASIYWEVVWAFTNAYGFDVDLINGNGGNRIALQYLLEGMKLQGCGNVSFCNNRDGILAAIAAATGQACSSQMTGPHNSVDCCLAVEAFAIRGLGLDASCGSDNTNNDNVDGFGVPTNCAVPGCNATASAIAGVTEICFGSTASFDASGSSLPGCTGATNYLWYVDGTPVAGATGVTYVTNPTLAAGPHTVDVRVSCSTDPTCSDQLNTPIALSILDVEADAAGSAPGYCFGGSADFDAGSTVATCSTPLQYQWYVDGSPVAGATNVTYATDPALAAGMHTVDVEVTCSTGIVSCTDRIDTPPQLEVGAVALTCAPSSASGAVGVPIPIGSASASDGTAFLWTQSSPTGALLNETTLTGATYANTVAGLYTVTLQADRDFGTFSCNDTCDLMVDVGGTGCSVATFNAVDQLLVVEGATAPELDFSWRPDPASPPAYHVNVVHGPPANLLDPTTAGTGFGAIACTSTAPTVVCTDGAPASPSWMGVLFYQALSACDVSLGNEGPF